MEKMKKRCSWVHHELDEIYHDTRWGQPLHDDQELFKMLMLEGNQAGLSWITILKKEEDFIKAYDNFDPQIVANYGEEKAAELLQNEQIIRNRLKINAAASNAKCFLEIQKEFGSFDFFLWTYVNHTPIQNHWKKHEDVPIFTALSDQISKDLKKRGFKFVGTTIIYSYMQAIGMVNDHTTDCFRHEEVKSHEK